MERQEREDGNQRTATTSSLCLAELPTLCLLILSSVAVVFSLNWLQGVLVPLTLAAGLSQLFEPVLTALARAPGDTTRCIRRIRRRRAAAQAAASSSGRSFDAGGPLPLLETGLATEPALMAVTGPGRAMSTGSDFSRETGTLTSTADEISEKPGQTCRRVKDWAQGVWDIIAVVLCTLMLLGVVFGFVWGIVLAVENFNFSKYKDSRKLQDILNWLRKMGITLKSIDGAYVWDNFKTQLMDTLSQLLSFSEGLVLTLLMFFFCLYATVQGAHAHGRRGRLKVKRLMQQYLLFKTLASLVIGLFVGIALKLLNVDLAEVFGLLTFVLNYIPNIGSAIATLAPLPLVVLDPDKDFSQCIAVVVVPFAIHNTLGCIIEPKLMSHGLDLHPLTVVVALTFWSSVWGVAGAVLSVPLTSVIRLCLEEIDHPYSRMACSLLNGPGRVHKHVVAPLPLASPSLMPRQPATIPSGLEAPWQLQQPPEARAAATLSGSTGHPEVLTRG